MSVSYIVFVCDGCSTEKILDDSERKYPTLPPKGWINTQVSRSFFSDELNGRLHNLQFCSSPCLKKFL